MNKPVSFVLRYNQIWHRSLKELSSVVFYMTFCLKTIVRRFSLKTSQFHKYIEWYNLSKICLNIAIFVTWEWVNIKTIFTPIYWSLRQEIQLTPNICILTKEKTYCIAKVTDVYLQSSAKYPLGNTYKCNG